MGVTVCVASGDNGSADMGQDWDGTPHADFPASSPFALACGGTNLKAPNGTINEVVWNGGLQGGAGGGGYDLVVLDGPAMPWSPADHRLFDAVDGLVAILPIKFDINDNMEDIITALGETERKLVGVVINELNPTAVNRQRDRQYA